MHILYGFVTSQFTENIKKKIYWNEGRMLLQFWGYYIYICDVRHLGLNSSMGKLKRKQKKMQEESMTKPQSKNQLYIQVHLRKKHAKSGTD